MTQTIFIQVMWHVGSGETWVEASPNPHENPIPVGLILAWAWIFEAQ